MSLTLQPDTLKNPLAIYALLPGTNCGQCGLPTCMAFAASVFQGKRDLTSCPHLSETIRQQLKTGTFEKQDKEDDYGQEIRRLQQEVASLDFSRIAAKIGATLNNGELAVPCLGRDFFIDQQGKLRSSCHVNHWLLVPLLHYLLKCEGQEPGQDWIPFADLPGAGQWTYYFHHRCETPLQQLFDSHEDLIMELFSLFGAQSRMSAGGADFSLSILPLPKVPFCINYWRAEEGFSSQLNILLDRSASHNITPHAITLLARGIVEMFRQLIVSHSRDGRLF